MKHFLCVIILVLSCLKLNAWNTPSISSPSINAEVWVGVRLNWNSVVGSQRYEVQVDTSLLFNSPLLYSATNTYINSSSGNADTQVDPPSLRFGTLYYWRVKAYIAGDTSAWNNSSLITRDFVNISSPSDGAEVWTGFTLN